MKFQSIHSRKTFVLYLGLVFWYVLASAGVQLVVHGLFLSTPRSFSLSGVAASSPTKSCNCNHDGTCTINCNCPHNSEDESEGTVLLSCSDLPASADGMTISSQMKWQLHSGADVRRDTMDLYTVSLRKVIHSVLLVFPPDKVPKFS